MKSHLENNHDHGLLDDAVILAFKGTCGVFVVVGVLCAVILLIGIFKNILLPALAGL